MRRRLAVCPDLPDEIALAVFRGFPALNKNGVARDRFDGLAQRSLYFVVSGVLRNTHIRSLQRDHNSAFAVADNLNGMREPCRARRLVTVVPKMRRHENEQQN